MFEGREILNLTEFTMLATLTQSLKVEPMYCLLLCWSLTMKKLLVLTFLLGLTACAHQAPRSPYNDAETQKRNAEQAHRELDKSTRR